MSPVALRTLELVLQQPTAPSTMERRLTSEESDESGGSEHLGAGPPAADRPQYGRHHQAQQGEHEEPKVCSHQVCGRNIIIQCRLFFWSGIYLSFYITTFKIQYLRSNYMIKIGHNKGYITEVY